LEILSDSFFSFWNKPSVIVGNRWPLLLLIAVLLTLDIRSKSDCDKLADQISSMSELPVACQQYKSVVEKVKAKEPEIDPFAGMAGGQAVSAKAARAGGRGAL
jgi:hypothetical protein